LSALHALNARGYLAALVLTILAVVWRFQGRWPAGGVLRPNWPGLRRRFRRPLPLMFLAIVGLALAAGWSRLLENGDSNAYRIPRILHWLAESGWHWIRTDDSRQNLAGCGYEWLCVPLMLPTHTERWIFLPNWIAYCLLPGLLFSLFRRVQIGAKAAWWWAWLLATGWCYALQACATDNDSISTVYVLAALVFALRARENHQFADLGLAVLSAAVFTGIKPTNLPLALPCLVALLPSWRLFFSRPLALTGVLALAALASFLPTAALNWHYAGSWRGYVLTAGVPLAGPAVWYQWGTPFALPSPFWGVVGNAFYLTIQNLQPPFLPGASAWNHAMLHFLQTPLGSHFLAFEAFGKLNRSVSQVSAGLGLSVVVVVAISWLTIRRARPSLGGRSRLGIYALLGLTSWLALLAFMAKVGACQNARYLAGYYPLLLLPLLRRPGMAELVRRRWWQTLVLAVVAATLAFMAFSYGRYLIPTSVFARLQAYPGRPHFLRILDDYYRTRVSTSAYRAFATRHAAGESVVGYATTCGSLEPGMWQPWGHGRVERLLPGDTPEWARAQGLHAIFIEDSALRAVPETIEQWLQRFDARIEDQMTFTTDPGAPPSHFYFCRLNKSGPAATEPTPRNFAK
jgi:hypothetical protein